MDLSCGNKRGAVDQEKHLSQKKPSIRKSAVFRVTALYVITTPGCVLFMGISWFHLYSLCRFGRLYKNVPILLFCLLWWIGAIIYGLRLWRAYRRNQNEILFEELTVKDGQMFLAGKSAGGGNQHSINYAGCKPEENAEGKGTKWESTATELLSEQQIRWFIKGKNTIRFFLKDKRVFTLSLDRLEEETKAFLMLKLSSISFFRKRYWRILAGILLSAMTVLGADAVIKSAMPWQGKLGTYLVLWQDKRTVTLVHDNVYEDGIEGVLEDIRTKIDLPKTLCLSNSFNMHFAPDGKILSLNTMVYGFDEKGNFTDSYLISYASGHSQKITVYLHGVGGASFEEEKDLSPLIEAVPLIPLEQTVQQWKGEGCYGILYYGMREWRDREGIRILHTDRTESLPPDGDNYFYGYSISLFCPDNERLTPIRYLYPDYINEPITTEPVIYPADYAPELKDSELGEANPDEAASDKDKGYLAGEDARDSNSDTIKRKNYFDGSSVHSTGSIWSRYAYTDHVLWAYSVEEYGSLQMTSEIYTDINGEQIYEYSYESFRMADTVSGAAIVNTFLEQKQEETLAAWKETGTYLAENETAAEEYPWNNTPSDEIGFVAISYLDEKYCSLVFTETNYTGGVRGAFSLFSYTIDLQSGGEVPLMGIADLTKEEWIERIDTAFEKEQGFHIFFEGMADEHTAGEAWYESCENGGWGSGYYLSDQGVVVYYGLGQITVQQNGVIEVVIPWEAV